MSPPLHLLVTVDVESDHWDPTRGEKTFTNLDRLGPFVQRLRARGLRPTLLTTWSVMNDPRGRDRLLELAADPGVELGAHLHPWSTPPCPEPLTEANTMLANLPDGLVAAKLASLTELHTRVGGRSPTTFRAGRWGLGPRTVALLSAAGYRVDCSVTPYVSWAAHQGPDFTGAPLHIYRLDPGRDPRRPGTGPLVEVPLTVGFRNLPFSVGDALWRGLRREPLRRTRLAGLSQRSGVVQRIIGTPELHAGPALAAVALAAVREGADCVQLALHSQSLAPGLSPFAPDLATAQAMTDRVIDAVDRLARRVDVSGLTVGEAGQQWAAGTLPSRRTPG